MNNVAFSSYLEHSRSIFKFRKTGLWNGCKSNLNNQILSASMQFATKIEGNVNK